MRLILAASVIICLECGSTAEALGGEHQFQDAGQASSDSGICDALSTVLEAPGRTLLRGIYHEVLTELWFRAESVHTQNRQEANSKLSFMNASGYAYRPYCSRGRHDMIWPSGYYPIGLIVLERSRQLIGDKEYSLIETETGFLYYVPSVHVSEIDPTLVYVFANEPVVFTGQCQPGRWCGELRANSGGSAPGAYAVVDREIFVTKNDSCWTHEAVFHFSPLASESSSGLVTNCLFFDNGRQSYYRVDADGSLEFFAYDHSSGQLFRALDNQRRKWEVEESVTRNDLWPEPNWTGVKVVTWGDYWYRFSEPATIVADYNPDLLNSLFVEGRRRKILTDHIPGHNMESIVNLAVGFEQNCLDEGNMSDRLVTSYFVMRPPYGPDGFGMLYDLLLNYGCNEKFPSAVDFYGEDFPVNSLTISLKQLGAARRLSCDEPLESEAWRSAPGDDDIFVVSSSASYFELRDAIECILSLSIGVQKTIGNDQRRFNFLAHLILGSVVEFPEVAYHNATKLSAI